MLGAIHTTIMTTTNTLLDLLTSPGELDYYGLLRSEAAAIFKTDIDWADPRSLSKLVYIDSTLRESLRRNPVLTRVVLREVVCKDGLDIPTGQHLHQGTWLAVPTVGVHHDERFYSQPDLYDPLRFAPKVSTKPAESTTENAPAASHSGKAQGLSMASDTYLAWGYGRHSWYVLGKQRQRQ